MKNEPIKFEKAFSVNVSELYQAWTEEQSLKAWWKPAGRTLHSVENVLNVGGKLKYTFESGQVNEGQLVISGEYENVATDEQLVYTWNWELDNEPVENGSYRLTVTFASKDEGSLLNITQEPLNEKQGVHPHEDGWEKALNDLEKFLTNKAQKTA